MSIEHDTVINLIDLAKIAATAVLSTGAVAGGGLVVRSKQNTSMKVGLMKELDKRISALSQQVVEMKEQVKRLENSHRVTQDLIIVHADHIKEGNGIAAELKAKINEIEERLPQVQDIMEKTFSFFSKAKESVSGNVTFKEDKKDG